MLQLIKKTGSNITLYYISTRELGVFNNIDPLKPNYKSMVVPGYGNDMYQNISQLKEQQACRNGTIAIFVHGWEESGKNVQERLDRVQIVSSTRRIYRTTCWVYWDFDTVWLRGTVYSSGKWTKTCKSFIYNITNDCPDAKIRIIAHSLGARVVPSALDSLHQNPLWTANNTKIASVHLLGACHRR